MSVQRVLEAIEEIKKGKMVIMTDDEDRENEGDLVFAATFSTPEMVNFMATHAKGLICVTIEGDVAKRLELDPMVRHNNSAHETAFTISVDAATCTTGISAFERDDTIKLLANPLSGSSDFVRPGHIFPLIAKEGGVLVRIGHTEGATDLCKLAGVAPVGVICEIMKDDGTMARRDDLEIFAKEHDLKIVTISDLVEYRLKRESLVEQLSDENGSFMGESCRMITFKDHRGNLHHVASFGEISSNCAVRFMHKGDDFDLLANPSKFTPLASSLEYFKKNGGIFIFLASNEHDGAAMKEYGIGAQILHSLSIRDVKLLTTHTHHDFSALGGFGLNVEQVILK